MDPIAARRNSAPTRRFGHRCELKVSAQFALDPVRDFTKCPPKRIFSNAEADAADITKESRFVHSVIHVSAAMNLRLTTEVTNWTIGLRTRYGSQRYGADEHGSFLQVRSCSIPQLLLNSCEDCGEATKRNPPKSLKMFPAVAPNKRKDARVSLSQSVGSYLRLISMTPDQAPRAG